MPHRLQRKDWTIALAFIVLLPSLLGIWYVDHRRGSDLRDLQARLAWSSFDAQMGACTRGNQIRAHDAEQDAAIRALARLTAIFLDSSVDLRAALGEDKAAQEASDLRDALKAIAADLQDAEQVQCSIVIAPPPFPRPS